MIKPLIAASAPNFDSVQSTSFDVVLANPPEKNLKMAFTAAHNMGVPDGILDVKGSLEIKRRSYWRTFGEYSWRSLSLL
jgi:hypothetical protein